MIEKVNPSHPDKLADRIAGAIVDLAYKKSENPKIAVEVLLGHGMCHIIIETSETFTENELKAIVKRISGDLAVVYQVVKQDNHLAQNQAEKVRCGDNGIFKGVPLTERVIKDRSVNLRSLPDRWQIHSRWRKTNHLPKQCKNRRTETSIPKCDYQSVR